MVAQREPRNTIEWIRHDAAAERELAQLQALRRDFATRFGEARTDLDFRVGMQL